MLLDLKLQMNLHQFPSSQTLQIPAASQLTSHSQHLLPHICTAMHLTCLWATAHPALRGEKGNPLCFKSLITPAGQTKWWHVEKRAWTQQLRTVLELHAQDTMQCRVWPHSRLWDSQHSSHGFLSAFERWDWNPLCNHRARLYQHLSRPNGFLLRN